MQIGIALALSSGMDGTNRELPSAEWDRGEYPPLMWRLRVIAQQALILVALVVFGLALTQPTVQGFSGPVPGFVCLLLGWPYYPSNAFLILSPVLIWVVSRRAAPTLQVSLAIFSTISSAFVCYLPLTASSSDFQIGCWTWAAAHCFSTVAFYIPVWRGWERTEKARPTRADRRRGFPVIISSNAHADQDDSPSAPATNHMLALRLIGKQSQDIKHDA